MADFEHKENTGTLFMVTDEQREGKSDNYPDFTGTINVEGKVLQIAAWDKESKNGKSYLSLSVSEKREKQVTDTQSGYEKAKAVADKLRKEPEEDSPINMDDIPF